MSEIEIFKYTCDPCNYKTNTRQYFYAHKKTQKHCRKCKSKPKIKVESKIKENINKNDKEKEKWQCPKCHFEFKHHSSYYRHKIKDNCTTLIEIENQTNQTAKTIQNIEQNIEQQQINNINITFNINSKEEAEFIKSILTPEKIMEICTPTRHGLPLQSYDIVKSIQKLSLESKKNNLELFNFTKTNARDNIINVLENNVFKKTFFKQYNLEDLHKFATAIMEKVANDPNLEPDKSYDEKMDLICDILKDYEYYKNLPDDDRDGTANFILNALEECEKESKIEHYNMTVERERKEKEKKEYDKEKIARIKAKLQRLRELEKQEEEEYAREQENKIDIN